MSAPIVTSRRDWKEIQAEAQSRAALVLKNAREIQLRSSLENPQSPLSFPAEWLTDMLNGGRTDAGVRVSEITALQVSTVFACVNLISSALGFLPLHIMELIFNDNDRRAGKRIAYDHQLYDLLRYEPNPEMSAFTFRKTGGAHALLWGNSYAEIERDAFGRILYLWPRNPAHTRPRRDRKGQLFFETTDPLRGAYDVTNPPPDGLVRFVHQDDMVHVPGLSLDGRIGQSTIWLTRQVMGLALAAEKFGSKFFGNGARPGGVLEWTGAFKDDAAREKFRNSWQEAQGGENAGRTAVLESGMKWSATAIANNDSQFLETRQFQRSEICGIFQVPPHMIGDTDKTNRANTEQIGVEFVTFTLSPWLEAWQQEYKRKLFPTVGRTAGKYIAHFETRKLTMPDAASLRDFIATVKQWGVGSTNDLRELIDLNPIDDPWADQCWQPINMGIAGQPPPTPKPGATEPEAQGAAK